MLNWRKKLRNIILIIALVMMLCFLGVNGNGQQGGDTKYNTPASTLRESDNPEESIGTDEPQTEEVEPEQKKTDLTVLLIDSINGSSITLRNCIVQLLGEMQIAEDMFTYNNTFYDGNIYKITLVIELKNSEENIK